MEKWNFNADDVYAMLPEGAAWSCSFGYPGQGGFTEYWLAAGRRWVIANGEYWDGKSWTIYAEV
jgi:hypothetical protein